MSPGLGTPSKIITESMISIKEMWFIDFKLAENALHIVSIDHVDC